MHPPSSPTPPQPPSPTPTTITHPAHPPQVSVSDFLTLFSARVHSFFWKSRPSWVLLGAAALSLIISTILACFWPITTLDGIAVEGLVLGEYKLWPLWVWIYCIIFWLLQVGVEVVVGGGGGGGGVEGIVAWWG